MPVELTIDGHRLDASVGQSLFECAGLLGVPVPASCQQQGTCLECLVEITEGMHCVSDPAEAERRLAAGFRLACQCRVTAGAGRVRCRTGRRGRMRIERGAPEIVPDPGNLRPDPAVTRDGGRVLIDGAPVDRYGGAIHGVALDLGTTTVVLRLLNLETGAWVAEAAFENPLRFAGSDVVSRIEYGTRYGADILVRTLTARVSQAIDELPVDPSTIYEVVVAGNTTMRDLFFGQDVTSIGQSPYHSASEIAVHEGRRTTTSLTATAARCGLNVHPGARVYGLPIISGHVGADAAACLLAIDIANEDRLTVMMDIGTNTELMLGDRTRVIVASCPAGPAFEGGGIACGMPALDGAVESVTALDDGTFRLGVIGDQAPEGLCGSGLTDLLSELTRTGRMNPMGRFQGGAGRIVIDAARDIYLLERDVSQLAQAKGATSAGLRVVFDTAGIHPGDVAKVYLTGGFGRHLRVEAAQRIGLIPTMPRARVVHLGNAAIEGASMALLSWSKRQALESCVRSVEHSRLETHPEFFDYFVEGCQFKPIVFPDDGAADADWAARSNDEGRRR